MIRNQREHEDRCQRMVDDLVRRLDLGWQKITCSFDTKVDGDRVLCETLADWEYRQATLRWNLPLVSSCPDDELYETAVHEIVHVLNASMFESLPESQQVKLNKLNELATENVSRVLCHLLRSAPPAASSGKPPAPARRPRKRRTS